MCTVRTGIHMYDVHTPGQSCVYDPSTSCFQLFVLTIVNNILFFDSVLDMKFDSSKDCLTTSNILGETKFEFLTKH